MRHILTIPFVCTGPWTRGGIIGIKKQSPLCFLGGVRGGKPLSKEMIDRRSEASVTMIVICHRKKKNKEQQRDSGNEGNVDIS